MCGHARGLRVRATVGRHRRYGRQAASADRLRVGIDGSGGGGQAKIAMSRQDVAYEDGRTDGRVQAIRPQNGVTACLSNRVIVGASSKISSAYNITRIYFVTL